MLCELTRRPGSSDNVAAMGKIYLVRHPAPQISAALPAQQWGLSETGREQVQRLLQAAWWPQVRHIYTSPEPKAQAVAAAAAERFDLPFSVHPELAELRRPPKMLPDYKEWVVRAFAAPEEALPGGESVASAGERVWRFVRETIGAGPLPAALVSHGIVLSTLRARLLGQTQVAPRDWEALPFGAVAQVESLDWSWAEDFRAP